MLGKHALLAGAALASPLLLLPAMPTERPHLPRTPGAAIVQQQHHTAPSTTKLAGTTKLAPTTHTPHSQVIAVSLRQP